MNILYEEDGTFKVGTVLADNDTSLHVETIHGKRAKVKASAVLLRFKEPGGAALLDEAQKVADGAETDFLWEVSGEEEFAFTDLAREYFGREPKPEEAAGILFRLHGSPMHFYKKGRGRYKPAPAESLAAAKASVERKRMQALQQAAYVEQLTRFVLPEAFRPLVNNLLYKPDRNSLEYKALEEACHATALTAPRLLEKCGALPSSHDFHYNAFLFEHFPAGPGFGGEDHQAVAPGELPEAPVSAFSIDDSSTTEIDDAFSVVPLGDGRWRVGVHIAAPALGIPVDSPLDLLAAERLSTVYMPGNKITMLPAAAIEQYTLSAGANRPAVSMYLDIAPDFSVEAWETRVESVPVVANLRHESLEPFFNEETVGRTEVDYAYREELHVLLGLANKLEAGRGRQETGRPPGLDYNFVIEGDRVRIVERKRGSPIDKVVSELMIHVNSTWAKQLNEAGVAAIYRSQMNGKVRMSTAPGRHVGLGVDQYAWSSSPLRRYVDLINQRQIVALTRGEEPPYAPRSETLFTAMRDFDAAYEAYNDFQRQMERYWCLRYLIQEGISERGATVIKENLVRFDGLPLVTRAPSLPELPPGTRVLLGLSDIDLLELAVVCHYKGEMPV